MAHAFLSDDWLTAVKALAENSGSGLMPDSVSLNLVVTGGPEGDRELHVADGAFDNGLLDSAPTKLTVPYDVAKAMFIEGDQQAVMQAFMSGQVKVEGDMSKLMAMQGQGAPAAADTQTVQEQVKAITL
jgi:hypothetical protein